MLGKDVVAIQKTFSRLIRVFLRTDVFLDVRTYYEFACLSKCLSQCYIICCVLLGVGPDVAFFFSALVSNVIYTCEFITLSG